MPRFEPFPGLRYDAPRVPLAEVVAPPYDVLSPEEVAVLLSRSPYNSVRIDHPAGEAGPDPYQAAARRLADWQADGILRRDSTSRFYGYRMTYRDDSGQPRQTIGVIGALGLDPPGTNGVFPHERTTPKAKSDRLQLLEATKVNTSPIWGLSLARGLSEMLPPPASPDRATDPEGFDHELWPITDSAAIASISQAVSSAPVVIADGHHRLATALTYQAQRRAAGSTTPAPHDLVMALVVELVDEQLSVQAIHRLISGLPPDLNLKEALSRHFDLTATEPPDATMAQRMANHDSPALVTRDGTWLMHPNPETIRAARHDLDSSRIELALSDLPPHHVVYQHGSDAAAGAVARGEAQGAILLRPVSLEQIAATGRGGERMPPKTTLFWPKPRTGFVFREVPD